MKNMDHLPSEIIFESKDINMLRTIYENIPKNALEYGGILCGNKNLKGTINKVEKIIPINSLYGQKDTYTLDIKIISNKFNNLCSPYNIIGIWHTHPENSPFPSEQDKKVIAKLKMIGCVVTNNIVCFKGINNNVKITIF